MANLQGFKQVKELIRDKGSRRSMYDELINEVVKTKGIFSNDTGDAKRAHSLSNIIHNVIRKRGFDDTIQVGVRERTIVFVRYRKKEEKNA